MKVLQVRVHESCCKICLSANGCRPWKISWEEMVLHCIPGVGLLSSCAGWGWRRRQVTLLDRSLLDPSQSPPQSNPDLDEDPSETFLRLDRSSIVMSSPPNQIDDHDERQIAVAKRGNCGVLFLTHVALYVVVFVALYTLYKSDRI